jgi:digeranylgeranylglycerophospholipid reductase
VSKDVAIIGGSTSGLFTASLLAAQGVDVRVFEASDRIEPSRRTLIVTDYVRDALGGLCDDVVVNRIKRFELFADGRVGVISLHRPDLVINRSRLILRLAEEAEEKGAKILTGQRFLDLMPDGERLNFTLSLNGNGDHVKASAEVLVGADGAFSRVAEKGGWPSQKTVPLVQAVVELPDDMAPDTARIWFIPEETAYFYWLIPHSKTHGVLGLIGEDEGKTRVALKTFLDRKGIIPEEFQGASIPLYTDRIPNHRRLRKNDVYLVGDAAGHVKVSTVGGIVTGLRGARGVAEEILNNGSNKELKALARELNIHNLIRKVLNRFTHREYIMLLDLLTPDTKRTLGRFHRDETPKLLINLFIKQPRLLLLGLRALITVR